MNASRPAVPTLVKYLAAGWFLAACSGDSPTEPVSPNDDVPAPASLALDPAALSFRAVMGGDDPAPQSVRIRNGGGATLDGLAFEVDYGDGSDGWLVVELDGTTAPATMTLRPRLAGLAEGSHPADVVVRSPVASNGDQRIAVTLELERSPLPDLAVTALEATASRVYQNQSVSFTATIVNRGEQASTQVRWGWYFRRDSVPSDPASTFALDPLQPGEEIQRTIIYTPTTDLEPGLLYAGVQIDSRAELDEASEENNALSRRLEVLPQLAGPVLSGAATRFGRVALSWSFDWPCADPAARLCRTLEEGVYELQEAPGNQSFETVFNSARTSASPFEFNLSRDVGTYRYRVRASGSGWSSAWSDELEVVVQSPGPNPPSGLTATLAGQNKNQVYLEWQDNSLDETSFRIETSRSADFSDPATWDVPANQNVSNFVDLGAPTTFYIRVLAVKDEAGTEALSKPSNVVVVTTGVDEQPRLEAPTMLQGTASGLDIRLTWEDNSSDETGFRIEYASDALFSDLQSLDVAANSTSWEGYDDEGPQTLFIRVRALRGGEVSNPSNVLEIDTEVPVDGQVVLRNQSSYPVHSILIGGQEFVPSGQFLPPGQALPVDLSPGSYAFEMHNGIYFDNRWWTLHSRTGNITVGSGQTIEYTFEAATAEQLMARYQSTQTWWGTYYIASTNELIHVLMEFDENGRYYQESRVGDINGPVRSTSQGRYEIWLREEAAATVHLRMIPDTGQNAVGTQGEGTLFEFIPGGSWPVFDVEMEPGLHSQLGLIS